MALKITGLPGRPPGAKTIFGRLLVPVPVLEYRYNHNGSLTVVRVFTMNPEPYTPRANICILTAIPGQIILVPPYHGNKVYFLPIQRSKYRVDRLETQHVGESERDVPQVFARARAPVPCVILDELDALVPRHDDSL
jgi:hypothetical protein